MAFIGRSMTAPASAGSNLGDQSDAAAQSYFNRPTNHLVGTPTTGLAKVTPQQEAELPARALITMHMVSNRPSKEDQLGIEC